MELPGMAPPKFKKPPISAKAVKARDAFLAHRDRCIRNCSECHRLASEYDRLMGYQLQRWERSDHKLQRGERSEHKP